jgi:Ethanolamine utilization protein EutJ (predicted chaperonin)
LEVVDGCAEKRRSCCLARGPKVVVSPCERKFGSTFGTVRVKVGRDLGRVDVETRVVDEAGSECTDGEVYGKVVRGGFVAIER